MSVKDRLLLFIEGLEIKPSKFESECNISHNYVKNLISGNIGPKIQRKISQRYPNLNMDWLLYGEGEMLKSLPYSPCEEEQSQIPLIPLYARAGNFDDFTMAVNKNDCEMVVSPIRDADFAITIHGDSMEPEYPNGSIVLIKKIDEKRFIDFSRVYVLNTVNGVVVKRLAPGNTEDSLTCVSLNKEYPDFLVNKADIFSVYVVCMVMAMK